MAMLKTMRLALLLALVGVTLPTVALAQDKPEEEPEDVAAKHFAKGRQLYGQGKYKEAITELLKAFELRPAPPILLNIGRTYEKLKNKAKALEYYRKFLLKARLVDPNRALFEKLVKKLEKEVGSKGKQDGSLDTPDATTTTGGGRGRGRRAQMIHTPIDSAKVRRQVTVQAELPPGVAADHVWVHFRKGGEIKFRKIEMARQGDGFVAIIPARFVTSTSLQYYIEARKKGAGRRGVVALAASRSTPHIIVVEGGRAPLGPGETVEIRSPYRTWFWVSAASAVALLGGSLTMTVLALDRKKAMEDIADQRQGDQPKYAFDFDGTADGRSARDHEKAGKSFSALSGVFLGLGIAAAGASGFLYYLDRKYVQRERRLRQARRRRPGRKVVRFVGSPWAARGGGGFIGRIDF